MHPSSFRCFRTVLPLAVLMAGAGGGCHKGTQLEPGAVMLDLSVSGGVTTPDELRVFAYDDTGPLWNDRRVPGSGALAPQSPTHLGTVLLEPGATQGALRVHVRGLAAGARVADGMLTVPPPPAGQFALTLEGAVPSDGDGDGIPDAVDDCPAVADPDQHGCSGGNDGGGNSDGGDSGTDAAPGDGGMDVAPGDGGGSDAINCDASGACDRAIGSPCADSGQCHSTFCVDGVCCANSCIGPCRSCNQPNNDGTCLPYPQGTDPGAECTMGMTCNGVGSCGPAPGGPKKDGELCGAGSECSSTFCKDGVCCNNACDTPCKTCATGTCTNVTRMPDAPECYGTMTCNAAGKCVVQ